MSVSQWLAVAVVVVVVVMGNVTPSTTELIELSYTYNDNAPTMPRLRKFKQEVVEKGRKRTNLWVELYNICTSEHSGTHLDAPRHHNETGWTVESIPIERLWRVPAVVVDVSKAIRNTRQNNYEVKQKDLIDWEEENGVIPDGAIVFIHTAWGSMVNNYKSYVGLDNNNKLNFPGLGKGAAEWIVNHKKNNSHDTGIVGVGIDTLSLDKGQSLRMPAQVTLYAANIFGLGNVANMDKLPIKDFYVTVLPMLIKGGTGAPARIIAEVGEGMTALAPVHPPFLPAVFFPLIVAFCFLQNV